MASVQRTTSASNPAARLDVDEQMSRVLAWTRGEAERAATATRDVAHRASLDRLAELPSFATLIDRFAQAASLAIRHEARLALLLIDLEGCMPIVEGGARDAEERFVVDIARRLAGSVRASDTVCRLDGDQFVVLLTDVARDSDAASASRHVLTGLERGATVDVPCSIGISFFPDHGDDVATLIGRADAAMYCAKAMGPGHCRSYSEAAVGECSAHLSVVAPVARRSDAGTRPNAAEAGPNDELREINEELLRISIRARDERDRAQHHLRIALEAADLGRWTLDLRSGEVTRSVRHDQLYGYPTLLPHWDLALAMERYVPEDRAAVAAALTDARTTGLIDFELRIRRADDLCIRRLHVSGETVFQDDVAVRIVGVVADVTDRRAAEDRLREAWKMEAIGRLTGGVAHDFNNLLHVIGGSVDLLAKRLAAEERTEQLLGAIRHAVANGSRLSRQLLGIAHRREQKCEVVSLVPLMPAFEELLQRAVNESIVVEVHCERLPDEQGAGGLWPCRVDCDELEVTILNLAVNARDAMPDGGRLTFLVCNRTVDDAAAARWSARGGEFVTVAIADTGTGMSDDVIARVFEPLFTTKPAGQGTGLGLTQVQAFAKASGGFVSIERCTERGTIVTIHLPRAANVPVASR